MTSRWRPSASAAARSPAACCSAHTTDLRGGLSAQNRSCGAHGPDFDDMSSNAHPRGGFRRKRRRGRGESGLRGDLRAPRAYGAERSESPEVVTCSTASSGAGKSSTGRARRHDVPTSPSTTAASSPSARSTARPPRPSTPTGLIVAPGFDRHPHPLRRPGCSGTRRHARRRCTASPRSSAATAGSRSRRWPREDADYLMRMLARVEGMPLETLQHGGAVELEHLRRVPRPRSTATLGVNAGFMVGHSALRRVRDGRARPSASRPPTTRSSEMERTAARPRSTPAGSGSPRSVVHHAQRRRRPTRSRRAAPRRGDDRACAGSPASTRARTLEFMPDLGLFDDTEPST